MHVPLKPVAATVQLALGVLAVLITAYVVAGSAERADLVQNETAGMIFFVLGLVLGLVLLILWGTGRRNRKPLLVMAVVTALLAVIMLLALVLAVRPTLVDLHQGLWMPFLSAGLAMLLWIMITAAALIDLRSRRRTPTRTRRLYTGIAIVVPLAVITALSVLVVLAVPAVLIRINGSTTTDTGLTAEQEADGWSLQLESDGPAVTTRAGLAIPTAAVRDHNAGVVMVDPRSGRPRWRYHLTGVDSAPTLLPTAGGSAVVVIFEDGFPTDAPDAPLVLDAQTGRLIAVWPGDTDVFGAELADTDPPVLFNHRPRGTNSVTALGSSGRRLWTFKPDRCADPRAVHSTPKMILVSTRDCDSDGHRLLGLDPRTGEERWNVEGGGESLPSSVGLDRSSQLEVAGQTSDDEQDGGRLQRRNLDTGAITWTSPAVIDCYNDLQLAAAGRTGYLRDCGGDQSESTEAVAGYDLGSGRRIWRHTVGGEVTGLTADRNRGLALVLTGERSCRLTEFTADGTRVLAEFVEDHRPDSDSPFRPGSVRCSESRIHPTSAGLVLQLALAPNPDDNPGSDEAQYRYLRVS